MSTLKLLPVLSILGLLSAPAAADSLTLGQKKFAKRSDDYFNRDVKYLKRHCGEKINASINWQSFKHEVQSRIDKPGQPSINGFCSSAISTVAYMCKNDPDAKAAIQKKINSYECRSSAERKGKKKGKRAMSLVKGKLTLWVDFKAGNYDPYVQKFLGNSL